MNRLSELLKVAAQAPPLQVDGRRGMADREKVIRGLTCCQTINEYCDECPYNRISYDQCTKALIKEALELLKEQPEIVRCGECIRRASYDCPIYHGGDGMHDEPDDWFCGDGERRVTPGTSQDDAGR